MALQMESMEQKQALESSRASGDSVSLLKQQLESARAEGDQLRASVASLEQQKTTLAASAARTEEENVWLKAQYAEESQARRVDAADFERRLAEAQASSAAGASSAAELEDLRKQLAAAEATVASLNLALESVANKSVEAAEQNQAEISALQTQLTEAQAALSASIANNSANASAASSSSGKADAEELKAIMQDVYIKACEVFQSEAPDSADLQYAAPDVVKRIRGVLKKVTAERSTA
jgi:chromosome segregation ATPase